MKFHIGPYTYRVEICRGRLVVAGVECDAATLDDAIMVCGELDPRRRLGSVAHQLHELYLVHYGHATPDAFATFFVDVHRQLLGQGGEGALRKLAPTPTPRRNANRPRGKGAR